MKNVVAILSTREVDKCMTMEVMQFGKIATKMMPDIMRRGKCYEPNY